MISLCVVFFIFLVLAIDIELIIPIRRNAKFSKFLGKPKATIAVSKSTIISSSFKLIDKL